MKFVDDDDDDDGYSDQKAAELTGAILT